MSVEKSYSAVVALRWNEGCLELLDQRRLPAVVEYVRYHSAEAVAEGIRSMVVRGAPAIGCAAAYGIALEAHRLKMLPLAELRKGLEGAFLCLSKSRPTAVNLFWALNRMHNLLEREKKSEGVSIANTLLCEACDIHEEDIRNNRTMGKYGSELLHDGARVLTHCNAGALATGGYGTALGVIRYAVESGKKISVIADETRPLLQGARLTAWEMVSEKIPVTLIADNMAGYLMNQGEIDAVIVGADRVAANGDVANKIGTYMVAVLANRHRIPFYVACPLSTIDLNVPSGKNIPIEERPADEVAGFRNDRWAPRDVAVRNPAFDMTPADLVTALITEKGVVSSPNREKIVSLFVS